MLNLCYKVSQFVLLPMNDDKLISFGDGGNQMLVSPSGARNSKSIGRVDFPGNDL